MYYCLHSFRSQRHENAHVILAELQKWSEY